MNTDNTSIAGETIDYGPCAFMDSYNPGTVFSSIDHQGRYAYGNQPRIALWNLARLAETLLPLLSEAEEKAIAEAEEALAAFAPRFEAALHNGFRRKLGILTSRDGDVELVQDLLNLMAENQADLTLTFRRLSAAARSAKAMSLFGSFFRARWDSRSGWSDGARGLQKSRRTLLCGPPRWRGEPGLHPPQSSSRGNDRGCDRAGGFSPVQ